MQEVELGKNTLDYENISEFDESEMSEISIEEEVDCLDFVQNNIEAKKNWISENSIKYVFIVENKGSGVFNEKTTVFPKVQTV